MSDFNITLFETCELLNRSKKSISRYIRRGLLHPERVKSQQGTLEYRFSKADIEAFKAQEALKAEQAEQTRQDRTEGTDQTGHLEGSFNENKAENDQSRQDRGDRPDRTGRAGQVGQDQRRQDSEVITLLKETTGLLRSQLYIKDKQISSLGGKIDELIERDRETNFILKALQDKVFLLEQPKKEPINGNAEQTGHDAEETGQARQDTGDQTGQDEPKPEKAGFWKRVFKSDL